jgi:hypothetical protein
LARWDQDLKDWCKPNQKENPQSRVTDSILQSLMLLHNIKVCRAAKNFYTQIIILGVKIIIIWHAEKH